MRDAGECLLGRAGRMKNCGGTSGLMVDSDSDRRSMSFPSRIPIPRSSCSRKVRKRSFKHD